MLHKTRMVALASATALAAICLLQANAAATEPKNYNDCILENMKGVTSDVAAFAIKRACREKYADTGQSDSNAQDLPQEALGKLTGRASVGSGYFKGSIYNGNESLTIMEVVVEFRPKSKAEEEQCFNNYKKDAKALGKFLCSSAPGEPILYRITTNIPPLSNRSFLIS